MWLLAIPKNPGRMSSRYQSTCLREPRSRGLRGRARPVASWRAYAGQLPTTGECPWPRRRTRRGVRRWAGGRIPAAAVARPFPARHDPAGGQQGRRVLAPRVGQSTLNLTVKHAACRAPAETAHSTVAHHPADECRASTDGGQNPLCRRRRIRLLSIKGGLRRQTGLRPSQAALVQVLDGDVPRRPDTPIVVDCTGFGLSTAAAVQPEWVTGWCYRVRGVRACLIVRPSTRRRLVASAAAVGVGPPAK